eukprot:CAMPEP_0173325550 /NCGR_PEP_ID=MMETSP1144-20121109/570_1 /TAXON_ID=483371 /ORGANISM="non described non described, Strain CCMP2298" /LENGTH=150 /DNA_ID=CAMNT_0014269757 /DNA_START=157 /DNA_END=610 /DNA_ORIENTATION=-
MDSFPSTRFPGPSKKAFCSANFIFPTLPLSMAGISTLTSTDDVEPISKFLSCGEVKILRRLAGGSFLSSSSSCLMGSSMSAAAVGPGAPVAPHPEGGASGHQVVDLLGSGQYIDTAVVEGEVVVVLRLQGLKVLQGSDRRGFIRSSIRLS